MSARDWRSRAGCADADPELFFPVAESGRVLERQVAEAKAVCAGCVVRAECLADAVVACVPYGIAGGLTAVERHGLRTRQQPAAPPNGAGGEAPARLVGTSGRGAA